MNNFSTVSDTNRLFFDTRRACLLAPTIFFLNKHMYCSQCKENPTHYLCLSSLCPINNIPVYSWQYSILIQIQHCFPGFPFGDLSATKQLVLFSDLPSQRLYFLGTEIVSCPFLQFLLSREHLLLWIWTKNIYQDLATQIATAETSLHLRVLFAVLWLFYTYRRSHFGDAAGHCAKNYYMHIISIYLNQHIALKGQKLSVGKRILLLVPFLWGCSPVLQYIDADTETEIFGFGICLVYICLVYILWLCAY